MAHRLLRHSTSRFSSPAPLGEKEPAPAPAEEPTAQNGQRTNLDVWLEPPVRALVPSFEDTRGLERVGVLENMQPLGTAPTQRLLQKLKLNYVRPSPRATPAQAAEEVLTPATEPAEKMELATPMEEAMPEQQTEQIPDIPPNHHPLPDTILVSSPPRGRPPGRVYTEVQPPEGLSLSPVTYGFAPAQHASPRPLSIQQQLRQDRLRTHVGRAIQEAQQKNTPNLVNGLARLREDAQFDYDLWNVVEAMMNNSPSPDQFKVFKRYIKSGAKKHRRQSQMSASPYQPSPQKFHELTSPSRRERSPKLSHTHGIPPRLPPQPSNSWHNQHVPEQSNASAYSFEELPVSPSIVPPHLGMAEPNRKQSRHLVTTSPHKRKQSRSGSTSSLSSIPSDLDENLPPPDESTLWDEPGEGPAGSGRFDSAGQRQATSWVATGSRLRSAATATNHLSQPTLDQPQLQVAPASPANSSQRFKKAREEVEFDLDELSRRKRHYLEDSFHDYNTIPRPESDERESVHGHPERPVPNDNPPPPVIHPNRLTVPQDTSTSLQAGNQVLSDTLPVNGTSRKRAHDEIDADELDLSSPDSYSPGPPLVPPPPSGVARAASRAPTPRAVKAQPAQKTRKSARVMVS